MLPLTQANKEKGKKHEANWKCCKVRRRNQVFVVGR